jgi:hypothetical protein
MASRPVALHRAGIRIYLLLKGGDDTQQYGDYLSARVSAQSAVVHAHHVP